jgi:hypothetical protein
MSLYKYYHRVFPLNVSQDKAETRTGDVPRSEEYFINIERILTEIFFGSKIYFSSS